MRRFLLVSFAALIAFAPQGAGAAMSSSSFQVPFDSLNDGGDESSSASFSVDDSLGEFVSGSSSSASFSAESGFRVGSPPPAPPPPTPPPPSGGGGGGGSPSMVTIGGWTAPGAAVVAKVAGSIAATANAGTNGVFTLSILKEGTFTVDLSATDGAGRTATVSKIVTVGSGQSVGVSQLLFPSTVQLSTNPVRIGDVFTVSGATVPGGTLSVTFKPPNGSPPVVASPTVGSNGAWSITLESDGLPDGAFVVEVTVAYSGQSVTASVNGVLSDAYAPPPPAGCTIRANIGDLNCDNRTNLQDVSIMLAYFGKTTFPAHVDLNGDRRVTLTDFSILLFHWKK